MPNVNRKWLPILLILVLGAAVFFIKKYKEGSSPKPGSATGKKIKDTDRNRGFDRRVSFLEYTQHAKCRMGCRRITQAEVEDIMLKGKINYNKSNVSAKPCPQYALEGITSDDQRVRIIFGQCDMKTKCITVIDLGKEWSCDCDGDDDKYKSRNQ